MTDCFNWHSNAAHQLIMWTLAGAFGGCACVHDAFESFTWAKNVKKCKQIGNGISVGSDEMNPRISP